MKKELWLRLKAYHFDDLVPPQLKDQVRAMFGGRNASTQAFASKLARKRGWTRGFALRAIEEYRKFLYLGIVSKTNVTPPKVIDQVWHEHLLFSRPYREFCRDVLERDFDHHPELVPIDEQTEAFHAQYVATLELYSNEFNGIPPADIWGTPKFKTGGDRVRMPVSQKRSADRAMTNADGDMPLFLLFSSGSGSDVQSIESMPQFGGGASTGGGGGSDWTGATGSHDSSGSSGGDGGDGGGGSGCSSSCGGD